MRTTTREPFRYEGKTVDEWVPAVVARIVERFDPLRIVLFGSLARGEAGPDSDIDLLVVLPEVKDKPAMMVAMLRALGDLPVAVDAIPTDPDEIARRSHLVGTVLRPALREGKVLYDREGGIPAVTKDDATGAQHLAEARRWLRYAREDLAAAEVLARADTVAPREACWLAQQAVEKAVKAVLILLQVDFPKTHNLVLLWNLIPAQWRTKEDRLELAALSAWATRARYPGAWPEATPADAGEAIGQARAALEVIQDELASHGFALDEPR